MKTVNYDIVVVGAGAGGLTAAIGLSKAGKNVALVEKGPMGGDCTNFGCVPSKALIHYGINQPELGLKKALEKVREKRQHFLDHESAEEMKEKFGIDVLKGLGTFTGKHTLRVGDHTEVTFKKAIIATGSHPRTTTITGVPEEKILTNEEVFELDGDVKNLVIIGGGYIGCELGEAFARLGVNVTILNRRDRLIPREEILASEVIGEELTKAGVTILHNTKALSGTEKKLTVDVDGESREIPYDYVLLSIGRISNTNGLGLEEAKINHSDKGIVVDDYNRTSSKHIFAVGDCVQDNPKFTHWADHEARGVIRNIMVPFWKKSVRQQTLPMTMYTSTEVARIGMTFQELQDYGMDDDVVTITEHFENDDRSFLNDEPQGFVTIHFSRVNGKILGATIVGPKAGVLIALLTQAKDQKISAYKLMNMMHAYPTKGRVIKKVAENFALNTLKNRKKELKYRFNTHMFKFFAGILWTIVIITYFWYKNKFGLSNGDIAMQLYNFISGSMRGPVIYMVFYGFRSIVLFPAGITTLLSGLLFGPVWGIVYTFIGENMGANIAYWLGKKLGNGMISPTNSGFMSTIKKRLKGNDYISVLLLRLIPLNFDLVNYACGIFGVKHKPYAIATAFGIIPGMVTYILAGASLSIEDGFSFESFELNSSYLLIAIVLYVVSFGIAFILKKKFKDQL